VALHVAARNLHWVSDVFAHAQLIGSVEAARLDFFTLKGARVDFCIL